jgi:hypothetical protein
MGGEHEPSTDAGRSAAGVPVQDNVEEVRSGQSGPWSATATWEKGRLPAAGNRVRIREGHRVIYDIQSEGAFRSVLIAGTLSFATDRDTRLDAGVINIQAGDAVAETGFDCDAHLPSPDPSKPRPALEVGTAGGSRSPRTARRRPACPDRGHGPNRAPRSSAAADGWISTARR